MKLLVKAGTTSKRVMIFVQSTAAFDGSGLTGLTSGSSGLVCYRAREDDGNAGGTAISLSGGTRGTWSSGGFVEKDATNLPGLYEFGIPDAALASGSKWAIIMFKGAANMAPVTLEIQLTAVDVDSATAFITGVNSVAPPTNWNLLSVDSNGRVDVIKINGTSQTARDLGASVLLSSGTGTGQLDFTSGVVKANTTQFAGQTVTAAAGVTLPSSVASPTNITAGTITTVTNLTNAPTTGDFTASMITALSAATPAVTVSDKTGFSLTSAYDAAQTAAQASDIPTATENADALLKRDMSAVTGESARSPLNALRFLRNRWVISSGTLTVYGEDDTTAKWTASTTQTAGDPTTGVDPT